MFKSKHYVPVLRWKAAEKEALKELNDKQKESRNGNEKRIFKII